MHGYTNTPYGKVVQSMALPFDELPTWDYVNPRALVHHLSNISDDFADMMDASTPGGSAPTRVLIYIDEVVPGNPLRHDKGRTMWAIYWAMLDWPEYVLSRTDGWPVFGVIQSKIPSSIDGGALPR